MNNLLQGIALPDGVREERVLSARWSSGRDAQTTIVIEVVETVPPAFWGHCRCLWNYEARRGEQVVRSVFGYAAVIAVPYTTVRTFVHANGVWREITRAP